MALITRALAKKLKIVDCFKLKAITDDILESEDKILDFFKIDWLIMCCLNAVQQHWMISRRPVHLSMLCSFKQYTEQYFFQTIWLLSLKLEVITDDKKKFFFCQTAKFQTHTNWNQLQTRNIT